MDTKHCRWGILGTANIARKNWQAIRDASNARLIAVASRDPAKSRQFAAECQAVAPHPQCPISLGSYDELIAHSDVDAVYIPLPTGLRKEWVIKAANAGKHILVEKPAGVAASDVEELISVCEQNQVQFMDGVMFMHSARLRQMRSILDVGSAVGAIRRITSQFSFHGGDEFMRSNIRTDPALEPHGCLGDLGWYCILLALWAMDWKMPARATGRILAEAEQASMTNKVPAEFSGELFFDAGVSASFFCSFLAEHQQWAVVSGDKGLLRVDDFVLPFRGGQTRFSTINSDFVMRDCRFDMHEGLREFIIDEPSNNAPGSSEANLFHTFSELVLSGQTDPFWPRISLQTQMVMEACLKSARRGSVAVSVA